MPSETPEPTQERIANLWSLVMGQSIDAGCAAIRQALAAEAAPLREEIERLGSENDDLRDRLSEQPSAAEEILLFQQQRDAAEANVLSLEAEIERLKAPRMFPLQTELRSTKYPKQQFTRIPWAIAERAYATYSARYGKDQSLERLAERGGFGQQEMDDFYPPWRDELAFPAQILALEKQLSEARKASEASRLLAADKQEELNDAIKERDAASSRAREEQGALRAALEAADRLITGVYRDWETSGGPDVCEHGYAAGIPCERCDHATFNAALAPPAAESQENQQQLSGKGAK